MRRNRLKIFLIWSSRDLFVKWSKTVFAIFAEGSMMNNSVISFLIWVSGSGRDVF